MVTVKGKKTSVLFAVVITALLAGCTGSKSYVREQNYYKDLQGDTVVNSIQMDQELEREILALNPEQITNYEVRYILGQAPAPRIMNVHGGVYPAYLLMESFSKFLIGMGYPESKIRNPMDGTFSYDCHQPASRLAGAAAWYYEKEGLRPMMVGHSQGGAQTIKALHLLAGTWGDRVQPWNPVERRAEERNWILDPVTGKRRPVLGLKVSYASATGTGGLIRFLPQQWALNGMLRKVPDSVESFTGFYMPGDILGGDWAGFSDGNRYHSMGVSRVRNVKLPLGYRHISVLWTQHLAEDREIMDWINMYTPGEEPELHRTFEAKSDNILWAADVWHSVKKHWTLELQRLVLAKQKRMPVSYQEPQTYLPLNVNRFISPKKEKDAFGYVDAGLMTK